MYCAEGYYTELSGDRWVVKATVNDDEAFNQTQNKTGGLVELVSKANANDKIKLLKNMCTALLNYGSAAQREQQYKTDRLANSRLSDSEKDFAIDDFESEQSEYSKHDNHDKSTENIASYGHLMTVARPLTYFTAL